MNNFDELNILSFETYFGEMGISKEKKKRRVRLADILLDAFFMAFLIAEEMRRKLEPLSAIELKMWETLRQYIADALPYEADAYISGQILDVAESVSHTTVEHIDTPRYTSYERAWQAAADESNAIWNYGDFQDAVKSGKTKKTWHTILDGRERPAHRDVDGTTIPITEYFLVWDELMRFPLDSQMATAKNLANCRCWVTYS